jgi:hypothetical protein
MACYFLNWRDVWQFETIQYRLTAQISGSMDCAYFTAVGTPSQQNIFEIRDELA